MSDDDTIKILGLVFTRATELDFEDGYVHYPSGDEYVVLIWNPDTEELTEVDMGPCAPRKIWKAV